MTSEWTLPLLGTQLDGLPQDCDFILSRDDSRRLFGAKNPRALQIEHFAADHCCRAIARRDALIFRKLPGVSGSELPVDPASVECFPSLYPSPGISGDDHPGPDCR